MSNRVYLHCTDASVLPASDEAWEKFFARSGIEYEASARIPLFWLLLFASPDLRVAEVANEDEPGADEACGEDDEDGFGPHRYAYLHCARADGAARLRARAPWVTRSLDPDQVSLYEAWAARIAAEPYEHIIVRTEELDMMSDEGQLEAHLREALRHLEQADVDGRLQMTSAIGEITGLWSDDVPAYEAFELVGGANATPAWPDPLPARDPSPAVVVVPRTPGLAQAPKPWWAFWR